MPLAFNLGFLLEQKLNRSVFVGLLAVWLTLANAAADSDSPVVHKVFLPPRLYMGNTGILPVQPLDSAAWIWHPAFADVSSAANAGFFGGGWRQPVLLRALPTPARL